MEDVDNTGDILISNTIGTNLLKTTYIMVNGWTSQVHSVGFRLTETSQPYSKFGRLREPSALKSSAHDTVIDGKVTKRLLGIMTVIPLTRIVPPERTFVTSVTVAL